MPPPIPVKQFSHLTINSNADLIFIREALTLLLQTLAQFGKACSPGERATMLRDSMHILCDSDNPRNKGKTEIELHEQGIIYAREAVTLISRHHPQNGRVRAELARELLKKGVGEMPKGEDLDVVNSIKMSIFLWSQKKKAKVKKDGLERNGLLSRETEKSTESRVLLRELYRGN